MRLLTTLFSGLLGSRSNEVPSDKLVEREGIIYEINSTTPFTGSSVKYHSNGRLEWRVNFRNGKRDGLFEWFKENGQLLERENHRDGEEDGLWESFHDNGRIQMRKNYRDGKRDGLEESFHDNGQLHMRVNYIDGEEDGLWEMFHRKGSLIRTKTYRNGVLVQKTKEDKLKELKNLYDQGLISKEVYEKDQLEILSGRGFLS